MAVSADEIYAPLHFPLRSRRLSLPHSLAAASSRTSLSSEGSKSVIVSYKCKQTTTGILTKKKKESYEGKFQRYITFETGHGKLFLDLIDLNVKGENRHSVPPTVILFFMCFIWTWTMRGGGCFAPDNWLMVLTLLSSLLCLFSAQYLYPRALRWSVGCCVGCCFDNIRPYFDQWWSLVYPRLSSIWRCHNHEKRLPRIQIEDRQGSLKCRILLLCL